MMDMRIATQVHLKNSRTYVFDTIKQHKINKLVFFN